MISPVREQVGVLLSGGLDSSILAAHLAEQGHAVQPFYIETGLYWQAGELAAVNRFLAALASPSILPLVVLSLPMADVYREHWSVSGQEIPNQHSPDEAVFLPGRNALLLVKAAVWCQMRGIRQLALAPLGTSPFRDAQPSFFQDFQAAMNCGDLAPLEILRPFAGLNKREVMRLGRDYPLEHTFSCLAPTNGLHCGRCNKCAERQAAFALVSANDPTRYATSN